MNSSFVSHGLPREADGSVTSRLSLPVRDHFPLEFCILSQSQDERAIVVISSTRCNNERLILPSRQSESREARKTELKPSPRTEMPRRNQGAV